MLGFGLGTLQFDCWCAVGFWNLDNGFWTLGFLSKKNGLFIWDVCVGHLLFCLDIHRFFHMLPFGVAFCVNTTFLKDPGVFGVHWWFGNCLHLFLLQISMSDVAAFWHVFCPPFFKNEPCASRKVMVGCLTFALWRPLLFETQKLGHFRLDDENKDEEDEGKSF